MEAGTRHVALVVVGRDLGPARLEQPAVPERAIADADRAGIEVECLWTGALRNSTKGVFLNWNVISVCRLAKRFPVRK